MANPIEVFKSPECNNRVGRFFTFYFRGIDDKIADRKSANTFIILTVVPLNSKQATAYKLPNI
jgi:hypothetical protein